MAVWRITWFLSSPTKTFGNDEKKRYFISYFMHISHKQIFITGHVQGVFFRDSTRQQATALGLKGGVRNLSDGRVEVQVSGGEEAVQLLIKWLEIGPKYAKVSTIEVVDIPTGAISGEHNERFEIWRTR